MGINFRRSAALASVVLGAFGASTGAAVYTRVALLTDSQVVPSVTTGSFGAGRFVIDTDANTVTYRLAFRLSTGTSGGSSDFSGPADPGATGPVMANLPGGGPVKSGTWNYLESQEADILNGKVYVTIRSAGHADGDLRGQIVSAVADMDGSQETPPNSSAGRGVGLFNIDPVAHSMTYYVIFSGLVAPQTAAHIHGPALPGTGGGILHPLSSFVSPVTGTWNYGALLEDKIIDGLTYVNIHTTMLPGGEIRGQIVTSVNVIDPLQEVPPAPSNAAGFAMICIDRAAHTLGYGVRHGGLGSAETAAHIHGYSGPGVSSGVLMPISPDGSPSRGTWVFPLADEPKVLAGLTYIDVHTTGLPAGEIRGQINFAQILPPASCTADLNGDGQVDFSDYLVFLNLYDAQDPAADFNQDGQVDFGDYLEFLNLYEVGC